MSDAEHAQVHRDIGAYVLGALEPAERDRFERHLSGCVLCRDELADLAVLPSLLSRLDGAPAEVATPDFEPIVTRLALERRRGRLRERMLVGIAAITAATALFVVIVGPPSSRDGAGLEFASADGAVSAIVEPRDWGMAVHISADDLSGRDGYTAEAVAHDGHRTQVASWSDTGGAVKISGACYLDAEDVARVEIIDPAEDEVLVVLDPSIDPETEVR